MNIQTHIHEVADEIAIEVVDAFSEKHPHVRLNMNEWSDLKEMIQREVCGHFSDSEIGAKDLLKGEDLH